MAELFRIGAVSLKQPVISAGEFSFLHNRVYATRLPAQEGDLGTVPRFGNGEKGVFNNSIKNPLGRSISIHSTTFFENLESAGCTITYAPTRGIAGFTIR